MNSPEDIRTYVDKIIKISDQVEASPLDIQKLLVKLNLSSKMFYPNQLMEIEGTDEIIDSLRGVLNYKKRRIYYRYEEINSPRMNFTIAHEIGHFFLPGHYEEFSKNDHILCLNDDFSSSTDKLFEIEANKFAADLLFKGTIAEKMINNLSKIDFNTINEFAKIFDVSNEATSRYLISNSPHNQVMFFYDNNNPGKNPSIVSSKSVEKKIKPWTVKSIFEDEMFKNEDKIDFNINVTLYNKYRLTANVKVDNNIFCKKFLLTIE